MEKSRQSRCSNSTLDVQEVVGLSSSVWPDEALLVCGLSGGMVVGECGSKRRTASGASIFLGCVGDGDGGREGGWRAAAAVQTVAFPAEQHEPIDLRRQDAQAAQRGGRRQVEGHGVEGDAVVPAVHPVHVREEGDAAREEGEQHHAAIGFVQPAVLKAELTGRETGEMSVIADMAQQYYRLVFSCNKRPSSRCCW